MISKRDISPISIYSSKSEKSTGGLPDVRMERHLEVYFDKISSFYGKTVYKFLYLVYDLETIGTIYKIGLSYSIDVSAIVDKYDIYFLQNLSANFFYLQTWKKNYIINLYDELGYDLETNRHVSEQIVKKDGSLELNVNLVKGDFFPIGLEISLRGPTERIYKLPIIVKATSYVL
jgi:hypothetical protein